MPNALKLLFAALIMTIMLPLAWSLADEQAEARAKLDLLLAELASAEDPREAKAAEDAVWNFWFDNAPTSEARAMLDAGLERREAYDYEAAENHFDDLVNAAPDYAEGYNQRAFARFLRGKYEGSLADIERTLELEPNHFGAWSGMYHVLRLLNRQPAAMRALQRAVEIHPWIGERGALPEEMWPDSYRKIHKPGQKL